MAFNKEAIIVSTIGVVVGLYIAQMIGLISTSGTRFVSLNMSKADSIRSSAMGSLSRDYV